MASIDIAPGRRAESVRTAGQRSKAPLAGAVFVVLVAAAFIIGGESPDETASAREIVSFYKDNEAVTVVACLLLAIAVPFGVIFGAAVKQALAATNQTAARWGDAALVGAGLAGVGLLVAALTAFALADGADNNLPASAMQAINSLSAFTWLMFVPGFGTLAIAVGAGVLSSNVISRWAGWLALVVGIACFIPFLSFFAFLLAIVWIPIVSVKLSSAAA
jgi:hypothetical protein